ncbi:hypothetical protein [Deinococcus alpinitundrae]|uniref:hypothetical protein n=1 Tax=Deinococcus alpinitundrae TaxID=468913 RepID=UPI0013795FE6|nr:hypothetical protein [Deinococcus alpinitundrae]
MKNDYAVRAYRTETKYDTHDELVSVMDVQVPAEALEFLRSAHNAQDSKDVTFTVQVANRTDGDFRKLAFTSKGSKMKDFVPVATLQKWFNAADNLTSLFDMAAYELTLIVEVREAQQGSPELFEEPEQPGEESEPTPPNMRQGSPPRLAGVLNAPKEVQALPSSDIEDADFTVEGGEDNAPAAD